MAHIEAQKLQQCNKKKSAYNVMMQKFKSNLMYDNQLLFIIMIIRKKKNYQ